MHPAFSILFFTTLAGTGQGLLVMLAIALLAGVPMAHSFVLLAVGLGEVLLVAGLVASFSHLGHKMRAWRAVLMWRTSWMSREVIVLPAFIGLVALWWLLLRNGNGVVPAWLSALVLCGALVLWFCTAMIYACIRFIEEWSHPLTVVNFLLIGLSSGLVLGCALATATGQTDLLALAGPWALRVTLAARSLPGPHTAAQRRTAASIQPAIGHRHQGRALGAKVYGHVCWRFQYPRIFPRGQWLAAEKYEVGFCSAGLCAARADADMGFAESIGLALAAGLPAAGPGRDR